MRVVGIVAEYNPLHNGHIYQLDEAKCRTGASYCVVVMSGNFVQRGEPACSDKFTRAQWAIKAGADLVIELPTVFAVSSAERFAEGAIRLLAATGIVTDIAFGCEEPDLTVLEKLAELITSEPPGFSAILNFHLKQGKAYPRARLDALSEMGVDKKLLEELKKPNNILAIEYLRSIRKFAPGLNPVAIRRIGGGYNDATLTGEFSSATAIRNAMLSGDREALSAVPIYISGAMQFDPQFPITMNDVGQMLLYRIRTMPLEELSAVPDVAEGFEHVLRRAAHTCCDADAFLEAIKTKRYTLARAKRIAVNALLGVDRALLDQMLQKPENLYLRVLALKGNARYLLSAIVGITDTPVIMRNADLAHCTPVALSSVQIDMLSTDLLCYALGREIHRDSQAAVIVNEEY